MLLTESPEDVPEGVDYKVNLNPDSLQILKNCKVEPGLKNTKAGDKFQFQRIGYFCTDTDSTPENLVFNRTVPLRDSWTKTNK